MKTKDKHTIEIPEQFADRFTDVQLEFRRIGFSTGSDHIEIHIFQPNGSEPHRYSEFKVIDETERTVSFIQSNNKNPEPYKTALFGLNLSGWETKKNWERDHAEEYHDRGKTVQQMALSMGSEVDAHDAFEQYVLKDVIPRLYVIGALYMYESENDESLTETIRSSDDLKAVISQITLAGANEYKDATNDAFVEYFRAWLEQADSEDDDG